MSIEHRSNDAAKSLATMACVLSLFITACGGGRDVPCGDRVCDPSESASSCAEDCGCGNKIANPGEECDGPDLGGGTCMDAVHRGGTLRCNADCTFDVTGCTLALCGNGVRETGEACDGADVGSGTCASIGYGGGSVGCTPDCAYDVSACCSDNCPSAGMSSCIGDTLRECVANSSGCLAWQVTNCAASNNVCDSSSGTAVCTCVDRCAAVGDTRCEGATIETCGDVAGCLDWTLSTNCATSSAICAVAPTGPVCALDVSAEDCADPYPLAPGDNVVAWTALNADYVTTQPSCNSTTLEGPDLVLSYSAPENGFIRFTMTKPASARQIFVVSTAACGMIAPEVACVSDFTPTTIASEFPVQQGVKYNFYVRDTNSGTAPLDNPLLVRLDETKCSTLNPTVTSLSPANGLSIPDLTPVFSATFDYPVDATQGVITLTGNMGTSLSYNLAMGPGEVAIINGGKTLQIDPGIVFPLGETVTLSWTGLRDSTCTRTIAPPTWAVALTGPPYSITTGTTVYADACIGGTTLVLTGTVDDAYSAAINLPAGFQYFKQPATQVMASSNGWLSIDTTLTSSYFSNVAMPNTSLPNGLIAPYWDDLDHMVVCTKTVGNTLVVQWNGDLHATPAGQLVQFQAILDPTDDSIEFVYGPNQQVTGSSATVGVEDQAGTYAVQYEFNTASTITANSSKKFTPQ